MFRTYYQCDYCHLLSIDKGAPAHQSVDCPHRANGAPHRLCIDLSAMYRKRRKVSPKLCVAAGLRLEGCSDPVCRLSHHGARSPPQRPGHRGELATPLQDRGQFKVLPNKAALQTAVGDTFVVEGAAAGAPDVLTAGKSGIPNLAAQAVLPWGCCRSRGSPPPPTLHVFH